MVGGVDDAFGRGALVVDDFPIVVGSPVGAVVTVSAVVSEVVSPGESTEPAGRSPPVDSVMAVLGVSPAAGKAPTVDSGTVSSSPPPRPPPPAREAR